MLSFWEISGHPSAVQLGSGQSCWPVPPLRWCIWVTCMLGSLVNSAPNIFGYGVVRCGILSDRTMVLFQKLIPGAPLWTDTRMQCRHLPPVVTGYATASSLFSADCDRVFHVCVSLFSRLITIVFYRKTQSS